MHREREGWRKRGNESVVSLVNDYSIEDSSNEKGEGRRKDEREKGSFDLSFARTSLREGEEMRINTCEHMLFLELKSKTLIIGIFPHDQTLGPKYLASGRTTALQYTVHQMRSEKRSYNNIVSTTQQHDERSLKKKL